MNFSGDDKRILHQYFSRKPVKKAYIFGSYARNEANKDSDLDILVELDYSQPVGMKFFGYQVDLEKLLNRRIDLVTSDGLSKYIKPFIDTDKILIYERETD
jgi:predicted nucleotidyltransferase